jgi:hypothetical protein
VLDTVRSLGHPRGVKRSRRAPLVALLLLPACFGGDLNPIEEDPGDAGVTIDVVDCKRDQVSGNVTLTFELTSESEYQSILVNGTVKDDTGTVLDTGTASLVEVKPGQTYRGEMILAPAGDVEGELTCEADLDFAQDPIGG